MKLDSYVVKNGKRLRLGYTTGSCAAAAAKAAAFMLLTGRRLEQVELVTPKGVRLTLEVREIQMDGEAVSCAIEKDSGDDPDVTAGALIFAIVERQETPGIEICGGIGVGRVTKPGLDQPVGAAAINSVPRQMIHTNVEEIQRLADDFSGLKVTISVPEGEALAKKTFNPRLGIVGGISILGTTGIVEPMSEQALVDTIAVELRQRRESGAEYILLTPGNYGSDYIREGLGLDPELAVQTSNYIGEAIAFCAAAGVRGVLLVGHAGKLVKLAGGMFNTHSKYGDCRMEIIASYAAAAGLRGGKIGEILQCAACDEAIRILQESGYFHQTMSLLSSRIAFQLSMKAGENMDIGAILFSKVYGELARTSRADELLETIRRQAGTAFV